MDGSTLTLELVGRDAELDQVARWADQLDADQTLATDDDRPSLFGRGFDGPMPGHNPSMPIHYDLHAWVLDTNPAGTLSQWNPTLHCG